MNNSTSNNMMKREFDILSQIPPLSPHPALYDKILSKLDANKSVYSASDLAKAEFDKLSQISNIAPPAHLYDSIFAKTKKQALRATVSKKWFAGAAAMIAVLICLEVFLITKSSENNSTNEIEKLVLYDNYSLYE